MISKKERLYFLLRQVPVGKVTTYKILAHAMGVKSCRAVGQMLRHNPDAPHTPCHRVVRSDGTLGGYMGQISGPAVNKKIALLHDEGIHCRKGRVENFEKVLFEFK